MGKSKELIRGYPKEMADREVEEKYLCEDCKLILRVPVQGQCGHRFCHSCAERLWSSQGLCPTCCDLDEEEPGILTEDTIAPDHAIRRELGKLKVHCIYAPCDWRGNFKNYCEKHEQECKYRYTTCECGERVLIDSLDHHKTSVCPLLKSIMTLSSMTTMRTLTPSDSDIDDLVRRVTELELVMNTTPGVKSIKGNNVINRIQELERQILSLETRIGPSKGSLGPKSMYATYSDLEQYKQIFKMINSKIFTLEQISTVLNEQIQTAVTEMRDIDTKIKRLEEMTKTTLSKFSNTEKVLALQDIRISEIEMLTSNLEQFTSFDGTFYWRIDNWKKCTREAREDQVTSIYSPSFFTGRFGYKMCMRLYPMGDGMGKNTHVSLFFVIMKGPYDALMQWPFIRKVSMTLLDQSTAKDDWTDSFTPDPNSSSFQRPQNPMNVASGCPKFYDLELLQDKQDKYLKNDTMFIKVVVDTKDIAKR